MAKRADECRPTREQRHRGTRKEGAGCIRMQEGEKKRQGGEAKGVRGWRDGGGEEGRLQRR